jgi:hypothetical protein
MNFKSRGLLKLKPEMTAKVKIDPLRVDTSVSGSCECRIGAISAYVGDIRIRAAVPFLKPRRKLPLMATVGGFRIGFKPLDISFGTKGISVAGVLGVDGIRTEVDGKLGGQVEGDVEGRLPFKEGCVHFEMEKD